MDNFSDLDLTIAAVTLSDFNNRSFGEISLSKCVNVSLEKVRICLKDGKVPDFLKVHKKSKIKCLKCFFEQELLSADNNCVICGNHFNLNEVDLFRIDLDYVDASRWLFNRVIDKVKTQKANLINSGENYLTAKTVSGNKFSLLFSVSPTLKDFYENLGRALEDQSELKIILGINLPLQFVLWSDTKTEFIAYNLIDFFNDTQFETRINSKFQYLSELTILSKELGESLTSEKLSEKLIEEYTELFKSLPKLALQSEEGVVSAQGNRFQKGVLKLLNLTLFDAKYVGGKNAPDGLIMVYRTMPNSLAIPLDVKSYKGKMDSSIDLNGYYGQFRKYVKAFKSDNIQSKVKSPFFIVIAYDFIQNDESQIKRLNEIEIEFGVQFVLFPLKSLLYLASKLHSNKQIFHVNPNLIEAFFNKKGYITSKHIDDLIIALEEDNLNSESELIRCVRANVDLSGR